VRTSPNGAEIVASCEGARPINRYRSMNRQTA
jgi:hypothetical protein